MFTLVIDIPARRKRLRQDELRVCEHLDKKKYKALIKIFGVVTGLEKAKLLSVQIGRDMATLPKKTFIASACIWLGEYEFLKIRSTCKMAFNKFPLSERHTPHTMRDFRLSRNAKLPSFRSLASASSVSTTAV